MQREDYASSQLAVLQQQLQSFGPQRPVCNASMASLTTFRIGGPAALLYSASADTLPKALRACAEIDVPLHVMGNGSNLLVRDGGIDGLVLQIAENCQSVTMTDEYIIAEAGTRLPVLARQACQAGLSGLEFACGIPGTLGGAVVMNAGAYGGQMDALVCAVTAVNRQGELRRWSADELDFGYRTSALLGSEWVVSGVELKLAYGDTRHIMEQVNEFTAQRRAKQPLTMPSAGSTFKRPPGHYAGPLIEKAGLKGMRLGDAQVSALHAGFIVNAGQATARETLALMSLVQNRVQGLFGVWLEPEVHVWGHD